MSTTRTPKVSERVAPKPADPQPAKKKRGEDDDGERHNPEPVPGDGEAPQIELARHPARRAHEAVVGAEEGA